MLFDLRGRGRRRAVQGIYLGLAILMGGGLVLFGIGGNTNGGLFDAFSSSSGSPTTSSYTKQIQSTQKQVDLNPKNAAAWAKLASLRLAEGGANGGFQQDADGLNNFREASTAWERYLALNPAKVDQSVARQMINVYGTSGLNLPDKAVGAMDLIIEQSQPPDADLYKQYALLAFTAGQTRKGDLAIEKAVSLSPAADRKQVRTALEALKAQVASAAGGAGATGATTQTTPAG
ncbi:MAG: hypothetical protein JWO02_3487 [Solirubrobacterales bacterium]|nr:hypothetical protein [Solirubrobacterales bacterium]